MGKTERREFVNGCTDKYAVRVDSPLSTIPEKLTFAALVIFHSSGLPFNKVPDRRTFTAQYAVKN
jgi:hypothetical protein